MRRCKTKHRHFVVLGTVWLWCSDCGAYAKWRGIAALRWTYPRYLPNTRRMRSTA
jgi:hypothetical protein